MLAQHRWKTSFRALCPSLSLSVSLPQLHHRPGRLPRFARGPRRAPDDSLRLHAGMAGSIPLCRSVAARWGGLGRRRRRRRRRRCGGGKAEMAVDGNRRRRPLGRAGTGLIAGPSLPAGAGLGLSVRCLVRLIKLELEPLACQ
jgi:hypothetical protein